MTDRFVFTVEYEEALMKAAARAFVLRGLFHGSRVLSTLAVLAILLSCVFFAVQGKLDFGAGLLFGAIGVLVFVAVLAWWLHWRLMRSKLQRMMDQRAIFRLSDESLTVEADSGAVKFPWRVIKDIWPSERFWLLMLAPDQFVTLPLHGVSTDALAFLKSKVVPAPL
jgi:hypothetical protein